MPSNQPVLLLRESDGHRLLPIWIGAVEATAIAFAQQEVEPPRPLTHDLLCQVLTEFEHELKCVAIVGLEEGVFYAELQFTDGTALTARPSDAIAIALRVNAQVLVSEEVLNEAAVESPEPEEEETVEAFREFLDNVSPEDFDSGGGESRP